MPSDKTKKELTAAIIGGLTLRTTPFHCTKSDDNENHHIFLAEEASPFAVYLQRIERTRLEALLFKPHVWHVVETEEYTTLFHIKDRASSRALQKIFDKRWEEQEAESKSDDEIKQIVLKALRMDSVKEEEEKDT